MLPTFQGIYKLPAEGALTTRTTIRKRASQGDKSTDWPNKITQFTVNLNCFGFLLATPARISRWNKFFVAVQPNLIKLEHRLAGGEEGAWYSNTKSDFIIIFNFWFTALLPSPPPPSHPATSATRRQTAQKPNKMGLIFILPPHSHTHRHTTIAGDSKSHTIAKVF